MQRMPPIGGHYSAFPHACASLSALGQDFVRLIRERKSQAWLAWLERAKGCSYEELRHFGKATGERVTSGSSGPHRAVEYWTSRRADHQAQIAQAPDVWASPYRSVAFAGTPCGLTSSCKGTQAGSLRRGSASRAGSHATLVGVMKPMR
jgi:hypothetical protein